MKKLIGNKMLNNINKSVLFVDDEMQILNSVKRLFRNEKFQVLTANSGVEALEILKHYNVNLVISDQRMPSMSGSELFEKVNNLYPHTKRVMMSGFADVHSVVEAVNQGRISHFLTKPWDKTELKKTVYHYLEMTNCKDLENRNKDMNNCSLEVTIAHQKEEILVLKNKIAALEKQVFQLNQLNSDN